MDIKTMIDKEPLLWRLTRCEEIFWENPAADVNPDKDKDLTDVRSSGRTPEIVDIDDAEARLIRFAPFIKRMFPQVKDGIIESPLLAINKMQEALADGSAKAAGLQPVHAKGRLFLKADSHLPVSGSVKARGGIYEVLKLAEKIAVDRGLLTLDDDYGRLAEPQFRELFSQYKVAVGSTGNLGLSIGIISAVIGFRVTVHMSADARQWKKDLLRARGVTVIEYPDDYEEAVAQGRREAEQDPTCHFVDDENSLDLFAGYSVAGKRLKRQLDELGITIDAGHRLYVYLPCGVGGAPGGITYGIKKYFGDNAYCFFAEPTHAPCMTLGLVTGMHNKIAVGDIGIDGRTEADGLAVGRPSALVSRVMKNLLSGCYTVDDKKLYPYLAMLQDSEEIFIEPSACAAFEGLKYINHKTEAPKICETTDTDHAGGFTAPDKDSVHVIWATGGDMVPEEEKKAYYDKGAEALRKLQNYSKA